LWNKKDLNLKPVSHFIAIILAAITPFYRAPLHHISSVVSNLPVKG
jgi:hypothetical protein